MLYAARTHGLPRLAACCPADLGAAGCGFGSPCIDPIFGPTVADDYWSATTIAPVPGGAWLVDFDGSGVGGGGKAGDGYVRAVRADL